jgi:hypothetical protein
MSRNPPRVLKPVPKQFTPAREPADCSCRFSFIACPDHKVGVVRVWDRVDVQRGAGRRGLLRASPTPHVPLPTFFPLISSWYPRLHGA